MFTLKPTHLNVHVVDCNCWAESFVLYKQLHIIWANSTTFRIVRNNSLWQAKFSMWKYIYLNSIDIILNARWLRLPSLHLMFVSAFDLRYLQLYLGPLGTTNIKKKNNNRRSILERKIVHQLKLK